MPFVSGFLSRPQPTLLRRAVFQIHLWFGLSLGVYAALIGLTGSVLVFEPELQARAFPQLHTASTGDASGADPAVVLRNIEAAYPDYRVSSLNWPSPPRETFVAYPARVGDTRTVFADPHTGAVLGELPRTGWLRRTWELHVYLLAGGAGLRANGIMAGGLLLLALSGLVVWWPGSARWKRAFLIDRRRGWRRIVFDLHSAVGIWTAALLVIWSVSALYLTYSQPFRRVVAMLSPLTVRASAPRSERPAAFVPPAPAALVDRAVALVHGSKPVRYTKASRPSDAIVVVVARDVPGDRVTYDEVSVYFNQYTGELLEMRPGRGTTAGDLLLVWLFPVHAGWFAGVAGKVGWAIFGVAPAVLFISGLAMWWNRVVTRS